MSRISKFFRKRGPVSVILSVVLSALFVVIAAEAATTIGTNVNTGGTLTVTGAISASSTLQVTGAVTTYGNSTFGDASGDINLFTGTLQASTTALFTNGLTTYANSTFGDASTDVNLFTGTLQASTTALFTNGLTTYGNSTFGDASTDVNLFTGALQASSTALFTGGFTTYGNLTVDKSATTTVTFNDTGINFDSNTLVIDPNADRVGVGTAAPNTGFEVVGTASSTNLVVGGDSTSGTIAGIVFGTCTYNPGTAVTASSTLSTNCTGATGVRTADRVFVTPRSLENTLIFTSASSTANDVIQVSVYNTGVTGDVTPVSATWDWMAIR